MDPRRCVNIDWLELYCYEPAQPRDIDYFVSRGFVVREREYGTRHWSSVFTILDDRGEDFLEVRRSPRHTVNGHHTIYPDCACNVRVVNRYCYYDTIMIILTDFLRDHGYEIRRIFRLDLCIDFKRFDSGDKPEDVVRRIIRHKYAKVYQSERTAHGRDYWNGCEDNSLSWGRKGSMIVTRLYNKSLELATVHDKPWIRQAWHAAGLIDDPIAPILIGKDGKVIGDSVWRLEFQINSSARGWFVCDADNPNTYVEHSVEAYWNKPRILIAIKNLIDHYFDFRIFEQGKKKYACQKKELFKIDVDDEIYSLRNSLVRRSYLATTSQEMRWMMKIKAGMSHPDDVKRCDEIIEILRQREARDIGWEIY